MVNFSYRRSAAVAQAATLVDGGRLGDLRHFHGHYFQTWLSAPVWGHWTEGLWLWRLKTRAGSGGVLGDVGCHILDMASAVVGPIRRVRCELRTFPKVTQEGKSVTRWDGGPLDANDTAIIELELTNGAIGVIQATRWATGHKNHLRLEVQGTRGALVVDLDKSYEDFDVCLGRDKDAAAWKTRTCRRSTIASSVLSAAASPRSRISCEAPKCRLTSTPASALHGAAAGKTCARSDSAAVLVLLCTAASRPP